MKTNKLLKAIALTVALTALTLTVVLANGGWFTGNAQADFNAHGFDFVVIDVPPDPDVGVPMDPGQFPLGTISGWDVAAIYFDYDSSTDTMYVGIDCFGICGDADGDGDPGHTSAILANMLGTDMPDLLGTETIAMAIDTDNDDLYEEGEPVVGVGSFFLPIPGFPGQLDISTFGTYALTPKDPSTPTIGERFGDALPNTTSLYANPSAAASDIEFSIANFHELPGFTFIPGEAFEFGVKLHAASGLDDGIGEDFVVGGIGVGADLTVIGDTVWFDTDGDGFWNMGTEPGIPGVKLNLLDENGNIIDTETTDGDGQYLFTGISIGNYSVEVAPENFVGGALEGLVQTVDRSASDQDGANRMTPWAVTIVGLEPYLKADFGYRQVTNPGAGTPGYWKNHPDAWPVDEITIGGKTYTKAEAIPLMKEDKHDKTTTMFRSLVAAKLNVLIGNDSSCIADTIAAADAWMAKYGPVGKGVRANSAAWKEGEPLYLELDDYNNGFLCAPARD